MKGAPIAAEDKGHPILKFWCVCGWRYFTGAHMDGKVRRHRKGSVLPRYRDYYWNRYSRSRRALIRNACFWVFAAFLYGTKVDWPDTKYSVLTVMPFIGFLIFRKLVRIFTVQTRFSNSDGVEEIYRTLRPRWRRRLERLRPPKIRWRLPDGGPISSEEARPILAENALEGGAPITSLRRMERAATSLSERRSTRVRTIMRHHKGKEESA